jgi:hypothetical protein
MPAETGLPLRCWIYRSLDRIVDTALDEKWTR